MISPNVKLWSDVILVVLIVTIELSIVRKKNRIPPNVTKVRSHVILENLKIVSSNVRKKNMSTTECDKSTIICNVSTA